MMAAAFAALGLPHRYVDPGGDPGGRARGGRWRCGSPDAGGANVTIPHKAAVAHARRSTSRVTPAAADAVNVVVREGDRLIGHNTDLPAIVDELRLLRPEGLGRVVLLGAGGAARAVELAVTRLDGGSSACARVRRLVGPPRRPARDGGPGHQRHARGHRRSTRRPSRRTCCAPTWRSSTSSTDPARPGSCARHAPSGRRHGPAAGCSWVRRGGAWSCGWACRRRSMPCGQRLRRSVGEGVDA